MGHFVGFDRAIWRQNLKETERIVKLTSVSNAALEKKGIDARTETRKRMENR